jgi:murein DD-endopeptidase MepM/ murein hydrolase activator NlpD
VELTWKKGLLFSSAILGVILLLNKKKKIMNLLSPVKAKITSPFGQRGTEFHNGVDLGVPEGTPIRASEDGVVLNVYRNDKGGVQMTAKLDNGLVTGYAHLSKAVLSSGNRFKKGDILALSGNTGITTGAHLHFTLRDPQGNLLDPQKYFSFA